MQQALETLAIRTDGTGLYEITDEVAAWLRGTGIGTGLVTLCIGGGMGIATIIERV